jgi:acid stress-induced BolA-like protein IbaG/YrbA
MAAQVTERKVRGILLAAFPGMKIDELKRPYPGGKIGGVLIWRGFKDLEQVDRQEKVWEALRAKLTEEERESLSLMITLTPDELRSIRAA